jgi:aspartyl-tRNA(Asn)/glutamyl-tRNA(Gln) amidotransferase subunit A
MPELLPFPSLADIADRAHADPDASGRAVQEALQRLRAHGDGLGALITLCPERAESSLEALRRRLRSGERPPLAGVPVVVKDNICTRGVRTTCASRILEDYVPPYDATVVDRLEAAGAVIVAKSNLDEFAMGSSTENSAFFPARNPWDPARTPGGSSGGSAAAVAGLLAPAALGSDTGGSIRQPAAFTGIVGLKPTYGRVSRYGLVAFGSSLDQVGPFARTVADAALLYETLAGPDPRDATTARVAVEPARARLGKGVHGVRVGIPREARDEGIDAGIRARLEEVARGLAGAGARIVEVSLPHSRYAIPTYYIVATSEASSNLARHDGIHCGRAAGGARDLIDQYLRNRGQGLGPEVRRRIILGTFCLSSGYYEAYYDRAMRVRTLLRRDYERAFAEADVLLAPTTPTPAFRLGEKIGDPLQMYLADVLTAGGNLAGVPGLVVPAGLVECDGSRLPVGLQITGPDFSEALLFQVGSAVEALFPEGPLVPPFPGHGS